MGRKYLQITGISQGIKIGRNSLEGSFQVDPRRRRGLRITRM